MRRINNEDVSLKKKRDKRKIIHTILSMNIPSESPETVVQISPLNFMAI